MLGRSSGEQVELRESSVCSFAATSRAGDGDGALRSSPAKSAVPSRLIVPEEPAPFVHLPKRDQHRLISVDPRLFHLRLGALLRLGRGEVNIHRRALRMNVAQEVLVAVLVEYQRILVARIA